MEYFCSGRIVARGQLDVPRHARIEFDVREVVVGRGGVTVATALHWFACPPLVQTFDYDASNTVQVARGTDLLTS